MTEHEYAELCAACDRLLRGPGTGLARLAIPMLHLINEHPGSLRQYAPLPQGAPLENLARMATGNARALARVGRALIRAPLRSPVAVEPGPPPARATVLIVSHLSSPLQLQSADDFYFGSLQQRLRERGVNSVLVLVDHLRSSSERGQCLEMLQSQQRQLLPRFVPPGQEARIWQRCRRAARRLGQAARDARTAPDRALATLAGRQALLGMTTANLRLHASIQDVCRRLRPDIVITTYEGDACERMIWQAAREVQPPPLCVGYQHTRIMQRAHAIRRVIGNGAGGDPDVILTLGEVPQAALAESPGLRSVRLITYGSHRRATTGEYPPWAARPRRCMVLPDADESECVILMGFAVDCARRCPDVSFILRPHPVTDFAALCARHANLRSLPFNVSVSSGASLGEDCMSSQFCLYRGSSAAMHAVLWGLKPFYVARHDELCFDPLFALNGWREVISSPQQFQDHMDTVQTASDQDAALRAWEYCNDYVAPVRPAAIDELLQLAVR